jgi:hypothetical protein
MRVAVAQRLHFLRTGPKLNRVVRDREFMRPRVAAVVVAGLALIVALMLYYKGQRPLSQGESTTTGDIKPGASISQAQPVAKAPLAPAPSSETQAGTPPRIERNASLSPLPEAPSGDDRLQRLAQTRDYFRALAAGDHTAALKAVKAVTNAVERETALLALVTEWTHGDLRSPVERADAIAQYGLEAGLGMELAKDPDQALLWANELTAGSAREAVIREIAIDMLTTDPERAFAFLKEQIPGAKQQDYIKDLLAAWGGKDTEAALKWADQIPDPAEHDAAIAAIRTQAPVGIGAVLNTQDGYPAIVDMMKGAPADLSGQINKGDRIVALAQGDSAFVDARNLSLADVVKMIRGDPGTVLQLQLLAADAPAGSQPRTVTVVRDQVKFKR